jgi:hypothetical protein
MLRLALRFVGMCAMVFLFGATITAKYRSRGALRRPPSEGLRGRTDTTSAASGSEDAGCMRTCVRSHPAGNRRTVGLAASLSNCHKICEPGSNFTWYPPTPPCSWQGPTGHARCIESTAKFCFEGKLPTCKAMGFPWDDTHRDPSWLWSRVAESNIGSLEGKILVDIGGENARPRHNV